MPRKEQEASRKDGEAGAGTFGAAKSGGGGVKRRRAAVVSTASTLQARALFESTHAEILSIKDELEELAEERRALIAADAASHSSPSARATSSSKAVLHLLPPSEKKTRGRV